MKSKTRTFRYDIEGRNGHVVYVLLKMKKTTKLIEINNLKLRNGKIHVQVQVYQATKPSASPAPGFGPQTGTPLIVTLRNLGQHIDLGVCNRF